MSALRNLLKTTHTFLRNSPVYSSLPMSVLLFGVEKLAELNLSCPCNDRNTLLIILVFVGPFIFLWALMLVLLMPSRNICHKDSADANVVENIPENTSQCTSKCWKAFAHSLIPPTMWVIFLFLDGDYLACSMTPWVGHYVFDQKLNRKWCQPYELANANENDLHQKYQEFVSTSQKAGYGMLLGVGSIIILIIMIWYCCKGTPPLTEKSVETQTEERVDTVIQVYLNTQDQQGTRHDMQTGPQPSAQDPQGETRMRTEGNLPTEDPQGMRDDVPIKEHPRTQYPEGKGEMDLRKEERAPLREGET